MDKSLHDDFIYYSTTFPSIEKWLPLSQRRCVTCGLVGLGHSNPSKYYCTKCGARFKFRDIRNRGLGLIMVNPQQIPEEKDSG